MQRKRKQPNPRNRTARSASPLAQFVDIRQLTDDELGFVLGGHVDCKIHACNIKA